MSQPYFERAGVSRKIDVRIGSAIDTLQEIIRAGEEPFDMIFIDADKSGYKSYFEFIMGKNLLKEGGVLLVDNTLYKVEGANLYMSLSLTFHLQGAPMELNLQDTTSKQLPGLNIDFDNAMALHNFNEHIKGDCRVEATILPIRDGVTWIMHKTKN